MLLLGGSVFAFFLLNSAHNNIVLPPPSFEDDIYIHLTKLPNSRIGVSVYVEPHLRNNMDFVVGQEGQHDNIIIYSLFSEDRVNSIRFSENFYYEVEVPVVDGSPLAVVDDDLFLFPSAFILPYIVPNVELDERMSTAIDRFMSTSLLISLNISELSDYFTPGVTGELGGLTGLSYSLFSDIYVNSVIYFGALDSQRSFFGDEVKNVTFDFFYGSAFFDIYNFTENSSELSVIELNNIINATIGEYGMPEYPVYSLFFLTNLTNVAPFTDSRNSFFSNDYALVMASLFSVIG